MVDLVKLYNMGNIDVKIKKERGAQTPLLATPGSAGYDLVALGEFNIMPGDTIIAKTGLFMEIPDGYEAQIRSRSGLSRKGIIVANSPGTIDSDYRGEIGVILKNTNDYVVSIERNTKVAQLVFNKIEYATFTEVEELSDTIRGEGGYGSTGK